MKQAPAAFVLASLLALTLATSADAARRARPSTTYRCADQQQFVASYPDPSTAVLTYRGHVRTLRAAPSADGVRYIGAGWQWWTKGTGQGTMARLKPGEKIASAAGVVCTAQR
jgi:membrane-bound inhibitor of C-type lysozyme